VETVGKGKPFQSETRSTVFGKAVSHRRGRLQASYFFLAAALCQGRIRVENMDPDSLQGI